MLSADFMRDFSDDFEVFNLGSGVNSEFNEYNPVMSHDGTYMLYTSRSDTSTGKKLDGDDGQFREDINLARLNEGRFNQDGINGHPLETFVSNVNTDKHEAPVYISKNEETIILFKDNDLWFTTKEGNAFTVRVKYPKSINFKYYHRHASLTADGKTMYFTAEVLYKKLNKFHFDLYKTQLDNNGQWSKPEALPNAVNSLYNEDSPEISADGKTLFFSSNRAGGYGGYDIYYFKMGADDSTIYRLDEPINSPANDIYFKMLPDSSAVFLSSNRLKGYGGMNIYKVAFY